MACGALVARRRCSMLLDPRRWQRAAIHSCCQAANAAPRSGLSTATKGVAAGLGTMVASSVAGYQSEGGQICKGTLLASGDDQHCLRNDVWSWGKCKLMRRLFKGSKLNPQATEAPIQKRLLRVRNIKDGRVRKLGPPWLCQAVGVLSRVWALVWLVVLPSPSLALFVAWHSATLGGELGRIHFERLTSVRHCLWFVVLR